MMKRILVLGVLLAALTLSACAGFRAMKGPFDGDAINPAFVKAVVNRAENRLELNPSQSDELRAIVEKMLATALAQRPESEELRQQLAAELRKERLDQKEVDRLLERKAALMRAVLDSGRDDLAALHATLDAEQRDSLSQLVLDHGKKGWRKAHGW